MSLPTSANSFDDGPSEHLWESAARGDLNEVQSLAATADINWVEPNCGATSLYIASQRGHVGVVGLLIAHRADVNHTASDGSTALGAATLAHNVAVVELLLSAGADPRIQARNGATPLNISKFFCYSAITDLLEAAIAKIEGT